MSQSYVLERTARELDRLDLQGVLYRDITRRALLEGGLEAGMRVLDIGCGSGDVSRIVAEVVGPSGSVLGVDRDPQSILAARARADERGLGNVAFEVGEIRIGTGEPGFDGLVGRFVLMHQPDPGKTLAAACCAVRSGGVVVVLESHMASLLNGQHSMPWSHLYDEVIRWKCRVVAASGADIESGLRLRRTFQEAGLSAPAMRIEACVEGGPDSLIYRYMAESVKSMLPTARQHGIEGFTARDGETLAERLRDDVVKNDGALVVWPVVSAWCRLT